MVKVVILAAGKGTRMNSDLPKVLVKVQGQPMIEKFLNSVVMSGVVERPIIVVSPDNQEQIKNSLHHFKADYVVQELQLGTGHAVKCAVDEIKESVDKVLVFNGDQPFIKAGTIKKLAETEADIAILTTEVSDFTTWEKIFQHWGRIIKSGEEIKKIIEFKDANDTEKDLKVLNTGMYCFNYNWLKDNIANLENNNAQGEFYLTDLIGLAFAQHKKIVGLPADPKEVIGINSMEELAIAERLF